jgi:pyruvate/2-oxoglutarate dehydrogenase complex dihydrolipoamide acyltransferase (E2) component
MKNRNQCNIPKQTTYIETTTGSMTTVIKSAQIHKFITKLQEEKKIYCSFGDVIVHAIGTALAQFPQFNARFENEIVQHPEINLGYSINLGQGSRIGIIRKPDSLSLVELSIAIKKLALRYIHNELPESEAHEATFTITNLSSFGAHIATPAVYNHQGATMAIASEYDTIDVIEEIITPTRSFNLTLVYDVRIANCQLALNFLAVIKKILETPVEAPASL